MFATVAVCTAAYVAYAFAKVLRDSTAALRTHIMHIEVVPFLICRDAILYQPTHVGLLTFSHLWLLLTSSWKIIQTIPEGRSGARLCSIRRLYYGYHNGSCSDLRQLGLVLSHPRFAFI